MAALVLRPTTHISKGSTTPQNFSAIETVIRTRSWVAAEMSEAKWMSVWGYSAIANVVVGASKNAVVLVEPWLLHANGASKRAANANEIRLLGYVT